MTFPTDRDMFEVLETAKEPLDLLTPSRASKRPTVLSFCPLLSSLALSDRLGALASRFRIQRGAVERLKCIQDVWLPVLAGPWPMSGVFPQALLFSAGSSASGDMSGIADPDLEGPSRALRCKAPTGFRRLLPEYFQGKGRGDRLDAAGIKGAGCIHFSSVKSGRLYKTVFQMPGCFEVRNSHV